MSVTRGDAPHLLDLFCGEGGATIGYRRIGFHLTGVDKEGHHARRYTGDVFIRADAISLEGRTP